MHCLQLLLGSLVQGLPSQSRNTSSRNPQASLKILKSRALDSRPTQLVRIYCAIQLVRRYFGHEPSFGNYLASQGMFCYQLDKGYLFQELPRQLWDALFRKYLINLEILKSWVLVLDIRQILTFFFSIWLDNISRERIQKSRNMKRLP